MSTDATDNPQNIQAGGRVSLAISEEPDPVTGGVVRVYRDAIGTLVADIAIGDDVRPQNVEFLTRVDPSYAQTVTRLVREYRETAAVAPMPLKDFNQLTARLHAAADRAGIARDVAEEDFTDEYEADPVIPSFGH